MTKDDASVKPLFPTPAQYKVATLYEKVAHQASSDVSWASFVTQYNINASTAVEVETNICKEGVLRKLALLIEV